MKKIPLRRIKNLFLLLLCVFPFISFCFSFFGKNDLISTFSSSVSNISNYFSNTISEQVLSHFSSFTFTHFNHTLSVSEIFIINALSYYFIIACFNIVFEVLFFPFTWFEDWLDRRSTI